MNWKRAWMIWVAGGICWLGTTGCGRNPASEGEGSIGNGDPQGTYCARVPVKEDTAKSMPGRETVIGFDFRPDGQVEEFAFDTFNAKREIKRAGSWSIDSSHREAGLQSSGKMVESSVQVRWATGDRSKLGYRVQQNVIVIQGTIYKKMILNER